MRVGELFAGIGGFGLGAQRAGCAVTWACEIDDFASRVYTARFPGVPIHPDIREFPDMTQRLPAPSVDVDCITAGFPCQDLSVAGKRKGLVGERSGLFWEIVRIAGRLRPRWLLLENVPGLLSSHRGRDFETVLAALDELGYGVSWRVLDAQFFGVPQRRRRVFIVGHLGAECPAEVLFEPESVSGNTPSRSKARAGVTQSLTRSLGNGGADDNDAQGALIVAQPLRAGRQFSDMANGESNIVAQPLAAHHRRDDLESSTYVTCTLSAEHSPGKRRDEESMIVARPITATSYKGHDDDTDTIVAGTLTSPHKQWNSSEGLSNLVGIRPRRLTPRECERLQGFPDDWTLIDGASDSARYRALGNAVAVPVVEWILRRISSPNSTV